MKLQQQQLLLTNLKPVKTKLETSDKAASEKVRLEDNLENSQHELIGNLLQNKDETKSV